MNMTPKVLNRPLIAVLHTDMDPVQFARFPMFDWWFAPTSRYQDIWNTLPRVPEFFVSFLDHSATKTDPYFTFMFSPSINIRQHEFQNIEEFETKIPALQQMVMYMAPVAHYRVSAGQHRKTQLGVCAYDINPVRFYEMVAQDQSFDHMPHFWIDVPLSSIEKYWVNSILPRIRECKVLAQHYHMTTVQAMDNATLIQLGQEAFKNHVPFTFPDLTSEVKDDVIPTADESAAVGAAVLGALRMLPKEVQTTIFPNLSACALDSQARQEPTSETESEALPNDCGQNTVHTNAPLQEPSSTICTEFHTEENLELETCVRNIEKEYEQRWRDAKQEAERRLLEAQQECDERKKLFEECTRHLNDVEQKDSQSTADSDAAFDGCEQIIKRYQVEVLNAPINVHPDEAEKQTNFGDVEQQPIVDISETLTTSKQCLLEQNDSRHEAVQQLVNLVVDMLNMLVERAIPKSNTAHK